MGRGNRTRSMAEFETGITKQLIIERLAQIQREHGVRILYACEAGSRAWGFPSPDSDYDVRFIYVRPHDWYLSYNVENKRDVIELPIDGLLDISGWDIRKAMKLLMKSNGALLEWLNVSDEHIYWQQSILAPILRKDANDMLNPTALCYHYSHMARRNARQYISGPGKVRLKKYLYVLRPLLAIRYILVHQSMPPVNFHELQDASCPLKLMMSVDDLLARKATVSELGLGDPYPDINEFIETELQSYEGKFKGHGRPVEKREVMVERLNTLFRRVVGE